MAMLSVMKDKVEAQQAATMAVAMAVAMAFDPKAGGSAASSVEKVINEINYQQELIYDIDGASSSQLVNNTGKSARAEDGGLGQAEIDTWKKAQKLDAAFSKLTGRVTGAPWSGMSIGNKSADMNFHNGQANSVTGKQIMAQVKAGAQRDHARGIRPGRRS